MKEEIIKKSLELFAEKGYENTSVSDILKEVEISKGGLYHYFASKEEILDNISEQFADTITGYVEANMSESMTNVQKLKIIEDAKGEVSDEMKTALLGIIKLSDPYIISVFENCLHQKLVPLIQEMFFSNIDDKSEREARSNVLFGLTQMSLHLPPSITLNASVMGKITSMQHKLILEILSDK